MKTRMLLISCLLVFVLGCNLFSSAYAVTFDIGTKISESDFTSNNKWYYFDSGCMLQTNSDYISDVYLLFDNNTSTGINKNYGPGHSIMWIHIFFPYPYYVINITVKPMFGGKATNYSLGFFSSGPLLDTFDEIGIQKTYQINGKISGIKLWLDNKGTNHFHFNDVIINYTSTPSNLDDVIQAINILTVSINSLQNQINILSQQIDFLNNRTNKLNNSIYNLNQTQKNILDNITNLWSTYIQLNESLKNFNNEIKNLNISIYENFTKLRYDLIIIKEDINKIYNSLKNITLNTTKIPAIQEQINNTAIDLNFLNENITEIQEIIPSEYNDTALTDRIFQLVSENTNLKKEIENHTSEIEKLTSELDELKETEKEKIIEKEADNTLIYSAILLGIIGILIAIGAISLLFKKLGKSPEPPIKEEPEITPTPEQQIIDYTGQTSQEQTQTVPEVQSQETPQIQQQQKGLG